MTTVAVTLESTPAADTPASPRGPMAPMALAGLPLGEDSFRRVVEWAPSAMVMIDRYGIMVLVNAQSEQMFGYPREALIGQSVEILVPERFRHHHSLFRAGFFSDPKPRPMGVGRDLAGCRSDGSEFPIEIGLNPIDTEAGRMVLASIIDITERQRAQQRLEEALRQKTILLNEVHHRVKNNLQVITSLLNLQADHAADPRLRAILGETCGRVKAMALTHQLLYERKDFSRLDLGDYLDRLVHSIRATYRGTGDRIALRLALPPVGLHIDLDRAIPCGLLVNELVTNAFKHAFPGERCGEIMIELAPEGDDLFRLSIADDGVGLPAETELASRSSLGLQLVPLLVEQLHGVLAIKRERGTWFCVRCPKRLVAKDAS
ncbi:putative sensory transduction histidine kinase [Candidatus Accumulibacter aalborgensis]|uniref:Putative sensory transduction histidine kinase n=1 Tax=Candidatus Accumulibacter aalborgensis TaxID=1860102 RepID=A0A1A8XJP6_9PROT|nr:histidine kinase dimerization/phosphoacceptor domain -containing protein [Candidatus Accumulibacter aalborgensis]SBT04163.1 putative sensory transduction histidine kinase [Candidatus Accumulibacter aalborgensis]